MVVRRRLDGFTEWNDNDLDKNRIREATQVSIERILDSHIKESTQNTIEQVKANVDIDLQYGLWDSPHQFKLACKRIVQDLLDLLR